jgi:Kef-type K+ transport system membrane component KefB
LGKLREKIDRAKKEKELAEARCQQLRGCGPQPPEGAAAGMKLQVPLPTRLMEAPGHADIIGDDVVKTRTTLQQLVQKVDRLVERTQPGYELSRDCSDATVDRNYAISRNRSNESDSASNSKHQGAQAQPFAGYDITRSDSEQQRELRNRSIERDASSGSRHGPYGLQREESVERDGKTSTIMEEMELQARNSENDEVLEQSLASKNSFLQGAIYLLALGGVVFTLVYPAVYGEEAHRRLGGGGSAGEALQEDGHEIITAISYCSLAAGLLALVVSTLKQPLLLGYILAGFAVGPQGLVLVEDFNKIKTISELGLVLLLFMIGLELDLHELLKMGKVVLLTGAFQFPICAGIHLGVFSFLNFAGLDFGSGQYAVLYVAFCSGISSTMIVVKLLSEKMETDTTAGRLTIGILIFQDIWAIVMLAIQPNMANPEIMGLLKTFGFMGLLITVAFTYSKYVLPAVFFRASSSPELMLILALAWCFFICAVAILSFVGLSMELAALIAGVSMATFPYNAELNGKVKYIRDYFITLYFVALGMQIPMPTISAVGTAFVVCAVVLAVRWIGIFSVSYLLGGGSRLAILATVNLSEVSEFGLVLCSIGIKPDLQTGEPHINQDTLTIYIWTFAILAVAASYFIGYNHTILHGIHRMARRLPCSRCKQAGTNGAGADHEDDHEERDIIILGFHKIAAALVAEFEHRAPQILRRLHVIDHKLSLAEPLKNKGVTFNYGDITSADVLEHAHHGHADLVLLTMPDYAITGITNLRLLQVARQVWPACHIIVIADDPATTKELYKKGADYVVATKKLSAERISDMLAEHYSDGLAGGELKHHLEFHAKNEALWNPKLISLQ